MPPVYDTPTKNARLATTGAQFDAGSGPAVLVLGTSSLNGSTTGVVATITLQDPSCATPASGIMSLAGLPLNANSTLSGTNVITKAEIRDSNGVVRCNGLTVGGTAEGTAAGKDIVLTANTVSLGQNVAVTAASFQHG